MSEATTIIEEEVLGVRDKLESIDISLDLKNIPLEDRKTALEAKTNTLLDEMKLISADAALSAGEKQIKAEETIKVINNLKNEFLDIGLTALKERKSSNITELKQLLDMYLALVEYFTKLEKEEDVSAELENIIKLNTYTTFEGETSVFVKDLTTAEDVLKIKTELGDSWKTHLENRIKEFKEKLAKYTVSALDVKSMLQEITPTTLANKLGVYSNNQLMYFKKKSFATFCKKKLSGDSFHASIKKDDEYFQLLCNMYIKVADLAITEDLVSDVYDLDPANGITTKAEYIRKLKEEGIINKICVLAALYHMELVQSVYANSETTKLERFLHISSLFTKEAYTDFRIATIKAIYLTPYSEDILKLI